jgi:hypothetical protein
VPEILAKSTAFNVNLEEAVKAAVQVVASYHSVRFMSIQGPQQPLTPFEIANKMLIGVFLKVFSPPISPDPSAVSFKTHFETQLRIFA